MTREHDFSIHHHPTLAIEAVCAHSGRTFDRHTHEQFGIGIVTQGAQRSASCMGQVEARQGDVITVHPGEVHDGAPLGDQPRAWRMLYLDPALVAEFALDRSEGAGSDYEFCSPVMKSSRQFQRCAELLTALIEPSAADGMVEELMITLLAEASRHGAQERARQGTVPAAIAHVLALMRDDPAQAITLEALARQADLSRYQLIRAVRQATGLTPHAYLLQCRVDLARRLIRSGQALSDVAQGCGFADQSHLNRVFVRRFGVTPGACARAART